MIRSARPLRRPLAGALLSTLVALVGPSAAGARCYDADDDGVPDPVDVCPEVSDPDQVDTDLDGRGDACDCAPVDPERFPGANEIPDGDDEDCDDAVDEGPDLDADGIADDVDVCPYVPDPAQADADLDGTGDACVVQRVVEVWPPPHCSGVPPGLAPRVRFAFPLEAAPLAAGVAPTVGGRRIGPLGGTMVLDADAAGFRIDDLAPPAAGERVDVFVPADFGLPFGFQWTYQLAVVDADAFVPAPDPAQGETPPWSSAGAALVDLDADGDLDLVLTGSMPGALARVYLNRGDATFDRVPGGAAIGAADVLEPGDYDGDRRVDVLARGTNGTVAWMRNVMDDGLVAQPALGFGAMSVALGDYDADGALDILAPLAGLDGAAGRVWRNAGGAFAARIAGTGGGMMSFAQFVDADADGDLDIVTTHSGPNGALRFWENGGVLGPAAAVTLTSRPRGVGPSVSGDLDGDGRPAIVAPADRTPGELFERAVDATFAVVGTVPENANGRFVSTDDDGDGDADLWIEALGGGMWIRARTDGGVPVPTPLRLPVVHPVFGDLDGDGDLDAVSPGTPAVVYLRRPDACPADPDKLDPGECGCGVAERDVDLDGATDCVDTCPGLTNPDQADVDGDGIGDPCDACPDEPGIVCASPPDAGMAGVDAAGTLDAAATLDASATLDAGEVRDARVRPDGVVEIHDAASPFEPDRGGELTVDASPAQLDAQPVADAASPRTDAEHEPVPLPDLAIVRPSDFGVERSDAGAAPPDARAPVVDGGHPEPPTDAAPSRDVAAAPVDVGPPLDLGTVADAAARGDVRLSDADRADARTADADRGDARSVDAAVLRGLEPKGGGGCRIGHRGDAGMLALFLPIGLLWRRRRRTQPAATSARPTCSPRA